MVYFRGSIFFMRSENLLCTRNCLLNLYQNASKNALKHLKESILPLQPKRPENSFLLYVKHVKPRFVEETPSIKYTEILKRASREWAELSSTKKEYFLNQYNKNREVYINKLEEYNNSITNEQRHLWKEKKKEYKQNKNEIHKRKHEMLGKPKKPPNAYFCYIASKKNNKNPNVASKEWIKSLSKSWKELSDAEKESYITEANELWTQYYTDLEKWEIEMIHSGHPDVVRPETLMKYKDTIAEKEE